MAAPKPLSPRFFARDSDTVARALIGVDLTVRGVGGPIVEVEAYDPSDPASHSYQWRQTPRNAVMFGAPGHAYVYRIYGMHWCLNFVCADASAVLIRALAPRAGLARMAARRGTDAARLLCSGPGRLCQALDVSSTQNGASLFAPPFALARASGPQAIAVDVRIGLTKGVEAERRYGLAGSPFVSRKFPEG